MAKYQRKPPVFDALQFTGETANAQAIIEGMSGLAPIYTVQFLPPSSVFGMQNGEVVETEFGARLLIQDGLNADMIVDIGEWVLASRDGTVEVLSNEDFDAQYQPIA